MAADFKDRRNRQTQVLGLPIVPFYKLRRYPKLIQVLKEGSLGVLGIQESLAAIGATFEIHQNHGSGRRC